ncbi:hypothetical protein C468_17354 [Halorubrum kocurii JCM 14978]|uniref:CGCGG family rSAM-modified RiPP protein n=1 Tax=Halorubrum kocurii JCM 14978 TaxID=1230456 RepID=M0NJU8_9EURY|nr:CGCGG family rSAM-modified RiPP protein [Halorubrum kocurii]EMA56945.1 hypothetical protein C468_17354 [Halorubrum kocurii JCM 14978]
MAVPRLQGGGHGGATLRGVVEPGGAESERQFERWHTGRFRPRRQKGAFTGTVCVEFAGEAHGRYEIARKRPATDGGLAVDAASAARDALAAIDHTTAGNHVNLVSHGDLCHPEEFLYDAIEDKYGLDPEYVERCGCGGHVTRLQVA